MKVRQEGRIVSVAVIVAVGVNADGRREVLSLDIGASEAEAFWTNFLRGLTWRALRSAEPVISNNHGGIKAAVLKVPSRTRQRGAGCTSWETHWLMPGSALSARWRSSSPRPSRRIRAGGPRAVARVGTFLNAAAIRRLVGAVLLEQNDEWSVWRARYLPRYALVELLGHPMRLPAMAD